MAHPAAARLALFALFVACAALAGCGSDRSSGSGAGTVRAGGSSNPGTAAAATIITPDKIAETRELVGKLARGEKKYADLNAEQQRLVQGALLLERERKAAKR